MYACLFRSIDIKDEATAAALKEVAGEDGSAVLQSLQQQNSLSFADLSKHLTLIRAAINTNCFLQEMQETGAIFSRFEQTLKQFDTYTWNQIKGKP